MNKQKSCFRDFTTSFASDVQSNKLPDYSFVIPRFLNADAPANSQHPPQDARYGDNLIADVYDALRANIDVWQKSVLIVLYDEHGGLYDHVIPPSDGIPNPDGINSPPPGMTVSWAPEFTFDRLGLRVPAIIASPWVAKGRVDSTRYQHTSMLATLKHYREKGVLEVGERMLDHERHGSREVQFRDAATLRRWGRGLDPGGSVRL